MTKFDKINYLNCLLIAVCVGVSFVVPFELFLFAYAVLGPLHYLTEISWLRDKNYFMGEKNKSTSFTIFCLFIFVVLLVLGSTVLFQSTQFQYFTDNNVLFIMFCFLFVGSVVIFQRKEYQVLFFIVALIALLFILPTSIVLLFFGAYLFTLIHVYVFTGLFLALGTLRQNNLSSWLCLGVFVATPLFYFFLYQWGIGTTLMWTPSDYVSSSYSHTFAPLNEISLVRVFGFMEYNVQALLTHPASVMLTRFIAFAYMYHYLNWFSKTSVIQWNRISAQRLVGIVLFFILAVSSYAYDYMLGYKILFILSLTHVVLEFPLNYRTLLDIVKRLTQGRATKLLPKK